MANRKRHTATPVHSMASEPPIAYEDIAVDTSEAEAVGSALLAEIEAEYDLINDDEVLETMVPLIPEGVKNEILRANGVDKALTGAEQDEVVDAIEQMRENLELAAKGKPPACPTCKRPFMVATLDKEGNETKSSRIRRMAAEGAKKGDIAREMGISYQFVHNVLSRPAGKTG
jgi:hypothetical protein